MMQPELYVGLYNRTRQRYVHELKVSSYTDLSTDTIIRIINFTCNTYNITLDDLISKCRKRELVLPRQICCYMIKKHSRLSLKKIGELIGGRDHSTVIYALETINDLKDSQKGFKEELDILEEQIIKLIK